jgi:hypothetical protein
VAARRFGGRLASAREALAAMAENLLAHVRWLGGSPCAGKSTVATLLAARHGLRLYACDDHFARHSAAADPVTAPTLARLRTASWEAIFLRPLRPMVRDAVGACREAFPMVLADLAALGPGPPVLAEGMALLPECVAALRPRPAWAAWLVPAPAFQRAHYARRAWAGALVAGLPEPARAFEHWMRRDAASARWVRAEARRRGYPVREVDAGDTVEAVAAWAARQLGLAGVVA